MKISRKAHLMVALMLCPLLSAEVVDATVSIVNKTNAPYKVSVTTPLALNSAQTHYVSYHKVSAYVPEMPVQDGKKKSSYDAVVLKTKIYTDEELYTPYTFRWEKVSMSPTEPRKELELNFPSHTATQIKCEILPGEGDYGSLHCYSS